MDPLKKFIDELEKCFSLMKCSICLNLMTLPTAAIPCGHLFCLNCLQRALSYDKHCPLCKQRINTRRNLRQEYDLNNLLECLIKIKSSKIFKQGLTISNNESFYFSQDLFKSIDLTSQSNLINAPTVAITKRNPITSNTKLSTQKIDISEKYFLKLKEKLSDEIQNINTCIICFGIYNESIIKCIGKGCKTVIHQKCYGIEHVKTNWKCYACQWNEHNSTCNQKHFSCELCKSDISLAFKPTIDGQIVHLFCAYWIPEINVQKESNTHVITGLEKVPKERAQLLCSICKTRKKGFCIQCCYKRCTSAVHPLCAIQFGYTLIHTKTNSHENSQNLYYCPKHATIIQ